MVEAGASNVSPVMFLIALGFLFGGILLQLVVGLLTPGRKGKIRSEKSVFHAGVSASLAWQTYARRLQFEGFHFEQEESQGVLSARRRSAADAFSPLEIKSFAKMALKAQVHFEPRPDGVVVRLVLWTPNSVYVDTGEGAFIDAMVERLIGANLEWEPPPVVPNLSGHAQSALYTGALMLLAPILIVLLGLDASHGLAMVGGAIVACITNLVLGGLGLRDVLMKPQEMRGKWQAIVGILLSIGAVMLTIAVFVLVQF